MSSPDPETAGPPARSGDGSRSHSPAKRESTEESDPGFMAGFCAFVWKYPNAMLWAVIVIGVSMWLWLAKHPTFDEKAFASAAVVEVLLSTDNVCIFHQFFVHFRVPRNIRTGVLFMGTPLMVVLRGVLFCGIKNIYYYLRPLMAVLGLFCIWQGAMVFYQTLTGSEDEDEDPSNSWLVKAAKRVLGERLIEEYHGSAFWVFIDRVCKWTPLVVVLFFVELTDVVFCVDNVSTIFMIDHSHVTTIFLGDIIAACLVRSLYPHLAETVDLFPDLNYSVACILTLVGLDMCMGSAGHEFPKSSIGLAMAVLFPLGILSSIIRGTWCPPGRGGTGKDGKDEENGEKTPLLTP